MPYYPPPADKPWMLSPERQPDLWGHWLKRGWVEGDYDGSLQWTATAPASLLGLFADMFFGSPISTPQYKMLRDRHMIPDDIIPAADATIMHGVDEGVSRGLSPTAAYYQPTPAPKKKRGRPKGGRKLRRAKTRVVTLGEVKPGVSVRVMIVKALGLRRKEIGRASLEPNGMWLAVQWAGVGYASKTEVPTLVAASEWLKNLPGVTTLEQVRQVQP